MLRFDMLSATVQSLINQYLSVYRRVAYGRDFMLTSLTMMLAHTLFCVIPVLAVPDQLCTNDYENPQDKYEPYLRWLMLSIFTAIPLLLDILLDIPEKINANRLEQYKFLSRIIMFCGLVIPSVIITTLLVNRVSWMLQCRVEISMLPAQSMIVISSLFCSMFRRISFSIKNVQPGNFFIERRTLGLILHMTIARAYIMLHFLLRLEGDAARVVIILVNASILIHLLYVTGRFVYVLVGDTNEFQFRTHHALNDFLHVFAVLAFLAVGVIVIGAMHTLGVVPQSSSDVAVSTLSLLRLIFLTCFTIFITIIPGRVYMLSAKIEQQKLQTRLNLIRYVSHEMRSPLNSAFLGLQFVESELSKLNLEWAALVKLVHHCEGGGLSAADAATTNAKASAAEKEDEEADVVSLEDLESALPDKSILPKQLSQRSTPILKRKGTTVDHTSRSNPRIKEVFDTAKQITASCNIALYTLNDLLTFDKLDEKKLDVELQPINPWHFATETARPFKINAKDSHVEFTVTCKDFETKWFKTNTVDADQFKLAQVLRNLISNAIKFTPANGHVDLTIEMIDNYDSSNIVDADGVASGHLVRMTVKDSGPGIAKKDLGKLFGQYVQFNPGKLQKGGGSGLGLWISKNIMELHGGTVYGHSEGEGHGCSFSMELPLQPSKPITIARSTSGALSSLARTMSQQIKDEPASSATMGIDGGAGGKSGSNKDTAESMEGSQLDDNQSQTQIAAASGSTRRRSSNKRSLFDQSVRMVQKPTNTNTNTGTGIDIDEEQEVVALEEGGGAGDTVTNGGSSGGVVVYGREESDEKFNLEVGVGFSFSEFWQGLTSTPVSTTTTTAVAARASAGTGSLTNFSRSLLALTPLASSKAIDEATKERDVGGSIVATATSSRQKKEQEEDVEGGGALGTLSESVALVGDSPVAQQPQQQPQKQLLPEEQETTALLREHTKPSPRTSAAAAAAAGRSNSNSSNYSNLQNNSNNWHSNINANNNNISQIVPFSQDAATVDDVEAGTTGFGAAAVAGAGSNHTSTSVRNPGWSSGLRFLSVDDTALNRKMLSRMLRSEGHQVDEACDGDECVSLICGGSSSGGGQEEDISVSSHNVYDAILMDENMPIMSGPEAASVLRARGYRGIIIGVTGDVYKEQMDAYVAKGANAVLPKPLEVKKLRALMEEMLN
mmetsp:Transcript_24900/g.41622  ORF Transcript_24900/g.41622 Transcript_24900/m.41622 type:complete len:1179 (-) Transcript_24900:387-3923(-)